MTKTNEENNKIIRKVQMVYPENSKEALQMAITLARADERKETKEKISKIMKDATFCVPCNASPEFCQCNRHIKWAVWTHIFEKELSSTALKGSSCPENKITPENIFKDMELKK